MPPFQSNYPPLVPLPLLLSFPLFSPPYPFDILHIHIHIHTVVVYYKRKEHQKGLHYYLCSITWTRSGSCPGMMIQTATHILHPQTQSQLWPEVPALAALISPTLWEIRCTRILLFGLLSQEVVPRRALRHPPAPPSHLSPGARLRGARISPASAAPLPRNREQSFTLWNGALQCLSAGTRTEILDNNG